MIWRDAAFDPRASWTFFDAEDGPWVRRLVLSPCAGDPSAQQRLLGEEARLTPLLRDKLLHSLNQLSFSLALPGERPVILDGVGWGMRVERGMAASIELRWRLRAPVDWEPMRDWWGVAADGFEQALPRHDPPLCAQHPWIA
ncbi:MAG: hypothetical protein KTR21_10250 [Rhodobacteraceae bacterium]|nr:hypothetical protein [Paracoccaceae bacterium]